MRLIRPRSSARMLVWVGVLTMATLVAVASQLGGQWTLAGHDASNTRHQDNETQINVSNVSGLTAKWTLNTQGDVSATPAVKDGTVYVPDWAGQIYAVDSGTGGVIWQKAVSAITGVPATDDFTGGPGGIVRTTPAVAGNLLIMGDQGGRVGFGATVFALDRRTGATVWKTRIQGDGVPFYFLPYAYEGDDFAIVTQSPVVDENNPSVVYVGTSSWEEAMAAFLPSYPCCSFRGAVTALDIDTGQILWQTYMAPPGYSGNGVWGSTGAIDVKRKTLYVTTGNNYSVPQEVLDCVTAAGEDDDAKRACLAPDNHFDAIVALNIATGAIRWATHALPYDTWNVNCIDIPGFPVAGECPDPAGPDYDFGQGPALFTAKLGGKTQDLVGAGQKSGKYWTLDRDTGQVIWVTQVGPGGTMGGLQWGSAVDDNRIYVAVNNSGLTDWTPLGATTPTNRGVWSALDKATGQILWQTETPDSAIPGLGSAIGAVTVANGVAYACTFLGSHVAMNASDGSVLWSDPAAGELCGAGAAVSRGTVYWGTGYGQIALQPVTNGTLTAYGLP